MHVILIHLFYLILGIYSVIVNRIYILIDLLSTELKENNDELLALIDINKIN